ncbi:MAG: MBL fold metallo-hydrolase [Oscillospiraceae bacterium]
MKITVLMENRTQREDMRCAHGLSLYIETAERKLLFDMGPDGTFLENARTMGIDLAEVDMAFLSHGHHDHAGGLAAFCEVNEKASIYMEKDAFGLYYGTAGEERVYAGIDQSFLRYRDRFVFTNGRTMVDNAVTLFSDVRGELYCVPLNDGMTEERNGIFVQDDFRHEQNLIVTEGTKRVLFTGCAHRGIVNILRRTEEILGRAPDAVVGGFHLYDHTTGELPEEKLLSGVAAELKARPGRCCTGHCTGIAAYRTLRSALGERCDYLFCGKTIEL